MKKYEPKPIDTSDVVLDKELLDLTQKIAANVHDVWGAARQAQGWTWGPVRNDEKKEHPDLVPYEELSEEEKTYDRSTAMESIKLIVKLGYKITREE